MKYCFHTTAYDVENLLPQVAAALDKRMEDHSREKLPEIWKIIDRLTGGQRPNEMTRGRRIYRRITAVLLILVGLFLAIPGLVAPDELFGPLLAGLFALGTGIYFLWSTRKNRKPRFEKQARKLLSGIAAAPSAAVTFSDSGMAIAGQPEVPYGQMTFFTETASGFFLNWADQATFLQKKDLREGEREAFSAFLREKLKDK